jgi:hypothetical protein
MRHDFGVRKCTQATIVLIRDFSSEFRLLRILILLFILRHHARVCFFFVVFVDFRRKKNATQHQCARIHESYLLPLFLRIPCTKN